MKNEQFISIIFQNYLNDQNLPQKNILEGSYLVEIDMNETRKSLLKMDA